MAYISTNVGSLTDYFLNEQDLIDNSLAGSIFGIGQNNVYGQLGVNNNTANFSTPVLVFGGNQWTKVAAASQFSAGIRADGTLWLWGRGQNGQIGDNTTINKSSPVQTITASKDWKSVSIGGGSTTSFTAAIKIDGSLWLWGNNTNGRLGDNTSVNKSSPVQTITQGNNWKSVSLNQESALAIKTDGTLWTWGSNLNYGLVGDNTLTSKSSPVQTIAGGNNWSKLGTFHPVSALTAAAIKTDGTLWMWGYNANGNLGDNTSAWKSSPVQTIAGGNNWKSVSCGLNLTAAIKTDGTLWMWGYNGLGGLGTNVNGNYVSSPVQTVAGGNNWKVAYASNYVCAIKTDGTLWGWGDNTSGNLGTNNSTHYSSPVQTVAGGNYWIKAGMSAIHTLAITSQ